MCKPPPDTKRPPRLLATPCPYLQTASIYGSPQSELTKARESRPTAPGTPAPQENVMDLSSSSSGYRAGAPSAPRAAPVERREAASPSRLSISAIARPPSTSQPSDLTVDLSTRSREAVVTPKASPFSAEALISKTPTPKSLPPLSMGIKGILEEPRSSSHALSSPFPRSSPSLPASSLGAFTTSAYSKPAAPVPPNPRASQPPSLSLASLYYSSASLPPSLSLPPTSALSSLATETTFSSLSSLPSSSLQPSNPYLSALMAPGLHPSLAQHKVPS